MTINLRANALVLVFAVLAATSMAIAEDNSPNQVELTAPKEAHVGVEIRVSFTGPNEPLDFISIDKAGAAERDYGRYAYVKNGNPAMLRVPDEPGAYQVRYHQGNSPYAVIGSAPLAVKDVAAKIDAPAEVDAGASFAAAFSGPNNAGDFVAIDKAGVKDREYGVYVYAKDGSPATLRAPDEPGDYVIRYHLGQSYRVIGAAPIRVAGTAASLVFAENAAAGSELEIGWTGPDDAGDFISIDAPGAGDRDYGTYAYTKDGSPVVIRVPEDPGAFVIRYHTGQAYRVLAAQPLHVEAVSATVDGPAQVEALAKFEVTWTGPNNPEDYVAVAEKDASGRETASYAYTRRGTPARLQAPKEMGSYELRYVTGAKKNVLARTAIEVVPGTTPGTLLVTGASADRAAIGAVELILDASGSMLQRLGEKRRIELAKGALVELTQDVLPAGAPFALRVFGHREADACRTDLEIPLAPLDRSAAVAKIRSIAAMNLAKTPIGDSLLQVEQDLAGVTGGAVVVLVTDGEETCGGDPKAAIQTLRRAGLDVRVNIVGFAIDELALKEEFEDWARLGGGSYFDADDGEALAAAIRDSLRLPFAVEKGGAVVVTGVVDGDPVALPPGRYGVKVLSSPPRDLGETVIVAGEQAVVELKTQ